MLDVRRPVVAEPHESAVGVWKFDEGSGDIAYDSALDNDGILKPSCPNCPDWVNGKFGKALSFDGEDDYVSVPAVALNLGTQNYTLAAWIYPTRDTNNGCGSDMIVGSNDFFLSNDWGTLQFIQYKADRTGLFYGVPDYDWTLLLNKWNHVVGVRNGDTLTLYVNGVSIGSGIDGTGVLDISSTWGKIGHRWCGTGTPYNGTIDEVMIFNKALTPDEVISLRMR
jgi:hypothetical protein